MRVILFLIVLISSLLCYGNDREKCSVSLLEDLLFHYQATCDSNSQLTPTEEKIMENIRLIKEGRYAQSLEIIKKYKKDDEFWQLVEANILERQYFIDSAIKKYHTITLKHKDVELKKMVLYKLCMLSLKLNDTSLYNQSVFDYTNLSLNAIDSARLNKVEGSYLMINGKYEESIRLFISALKTFTNHERMYEIIELHNLIGANYAQAKFFDEGLTYFRTGLTVAKKMKIDRLAAELLTNIGGLYMESNKLDSAEYYLKLGLSQHLTLDNHRSAASSYSSLGAVYAMKGDNELAINYLNSSLIFGNKSNDISMLTAANIQLGKIYLSMDKNDLSINHFMSAIRLARKNNYKRALMVSHLDLSKAYSNLKKYDSAYFHKDLGDKLKDQLLGAEKSNLISEIRVGYEKELKQKENEKLTIQLKARRKQMIYLIVGGIITVLFVLLISFYLYKLNVKNKQLVTIQKQKIRIKDEQVTESENKINQLNTLLKQQKSSDIASKESSSHAIEKLINTKNWSVFMVEFNGVYEDFVSKVNQLHPNVTPKDLRIIALIKMNLLDKEIADILNIEYSSFRKAKSRLKKKLEIDDNVSLSQYIFNL